MSESAGRTLTVAAVLCGVCSVLVAGAVVVLKPMQTKNREIDFKKNILLSAGLLMPEVDVNKAFEQVESVIVNLENGEIVSDLDPNTFNQDKADKDPAYIETIAKKSDIAGIKRRAKYQKVYLVKQNGEIDQIVLHVYGKGLWSTMKGFLALDKDAVTVRGFNFYSHAETPGLGGEIDNPEWLSQWPGKKVYDENMNPAIDVVKGKVNPNAANVEYKIDGLSGATLTSVGVENTFQFWLSENGYGKFLANFRNEVVNED